MSHALEVLKVASPCFEDFDAMRNEGDRRFCETCQRHVHDISKLTREAATDLVCRAAGPHCISYERNLVTGEVVTLDYSRSRRRRWPMVAVLVVATGGTGGALQLALRKAPVPVMAPMMLVKGEMVAPLQAPPGTAVVIRAKPVQ